MNAVSFVTNYESGLLSDSEIVEGFATLIASGLAWNLQGSYGRTATALINLGYITESGVVTERGKAVQ